MFADYDDYVNALKGVNGAVGTMVDSSAPSSSSSQPRRFTVGLLATSVGEARSWIPSSTSGRPTVLLGDGKLARLSPNQPNNNNNMNATSNNMNSLSGGGGESPSVVLDDASMCLVLFATDWCGVRYGATIISYEYMSSLKGAFNPSSSAAAAGMIPRATSPPLALLSSSGNHNNGVGRAGSPSLISSSSWAARIECFCESVAEGRGGLFFAAKDVLNIVMAVSNEPTHHDSPFATAAPKNTCSFGISIPDGGHVTNSNNQAGGGEERAFHRFVGMTTAMLASSYRLGWIRESREARRLSNALVESATTRSRVSDALSGLQGGGGGGQSISSEPPSSRGLRVEETSGGGASNASTLVARPRVQIGQPARGRGRGVRIGQ